MYCSKRWGWETCTGDTEQDGGLRWKQERWEMLQGRKHKEKRRKEHGRSLVCAIWPSRTLGKEKPQNGWLEATRSYEGQKHPASSVSCHWAPSLQSFWLSEVIMLGTICYSSHGELILAWTKIHPWSLGPWFLMALLFRFVLSCLVLTAELRMTLNAF